MPLYWHLFFFFAFFYQKGRLVHNIILCSLQPKNNYFLSFINIMPPLAIHGTPLVYLRLPSDFCNVAIIRLAVAEKQISLHFPKWQQEHTENKRLTRLSLFVLYFVEKCNVAITLYLFFLPWESERSLYFLPCGSSRKTSRNSSFSKFSAHPFLFP